MKRARVGYFAGTDSTLLTRLICEGWDTLPISNGFDNHGKHVRLINEDSRIELLIGYLHKVYAPADAETRFQDIFHVCRTYRLPLLLLVPAALHEQARALLGELPRVVHLADPADAADKALELLGR